MTSRIVLIALLVGLAACNGPKKEKEDGPDPSPSQRVEEKEPRPKKNQPSRKVEHPQVAEFKKRVRAYLEEARAGAKLLTIAPSFGDAGVSRDGSRGGQSRHADNRIDSSRLTQNEIRHDCHD